MWSAIFVCILFSCSWIQEGSADGIQADELYVGCFEDQGTRALPHAFMSSNEMTITKCIRHCKDSNYLYAGLQYASQCFCGNDGYDRYSAQPDSDCDTACSGDASITCGGDWSNQVYRTDIYLGCFEDASSRALPSAFISSNTMTISTCLSFCGERGYRFAGLQNGNQCFCGNDGYARHSARPDSDCATDCSGDNTASCGAGWRNAVYRTVVTKRLGCFEDKAARDLPYAFVSSGSDMTVDFCLQHCFKRGYRFAGLQYASQCFCGDEQFGRYGARPGFECSAMCSGDSSSTCGGNWRNEVYEL